MLDSFRGSFNHQLVIKTFKTFNPKEVRKGPTNSLPVTFHRRVMRHSLTSSSSFPPPPSQTKSILRQHPKVTVSMKIIVYRRHNHHRPHTEEQHILIGRLVIPFEKVSSPSALPPTSTAVTKRKAVKRSCPATTTTGRAHSYNKPS